MRFGGSGIGSGNGKIQSDNPLHLMIVRRDAWKTSLNCIRRLWRESAGKIKEGALEDEQSCEIYS